MELNPQETRIRHLFRLGIFLKGIHAVIEIVGGLLLLVIPLRAFAHLAILLTQAELLEEPHDFVANYVMHFGTQLTSDSKTFGGAYLLSHGLVKLVLVVALLKNKLWAYPWSLIVLGLFIVYQMYRFTFTHSFALILLTIFDLVVIWLIWREYQIVKKHRQSA
jgi:uncharacterized membrane protein